MELYSDKSIQTGGRIALIVNDYMISDLFAVTVKTERRISQQSIPER
ncbi:MAG: hypothetical protein V8S42_01910 [Lachnospiraceae bacterium]